MPSVIDLAGQQFGRWTVLERAPVARYVTGDTREAMWRCRCDCGTERSVSGKDLRYGKSQSCNCLKLEQAAKRLEKHGLSYHPQFHAWQQMRERCRNQNDPAWPNYGGRGIIVCDRWQDFTNFLADMGPRPPGHSIDRIDNDGPYAPGNCRWATRQQQNNNQRPRRWWKRPQGV